MLLRHQINPCIHKQPFLQIQLRERCGRHFTDILHLQRTEIVMQINNEIITLAAQHISHFADIFFYSDHLTYIRIALCYSAELFFGNKVNFRSCLFPYTTDYRCGENDITNGTESYDQYFFHCVAKGTKRKSPATFPCRAFSIG